MSEYSSKGFISFMLNNVFSPNNALKLIKQHSNICNNVSITTETIESSITLKHRTLSMKH